MRQACIVGASKFQRPSVCLSVTYVFWVAKRCVLQPLRLFTSHFFLSLRGASSFRKFDSGLSISRYCTTISAGSMSPTEYNSSSPCWCTDVSMELFRCTRRKVAHKQPTSSAVNTCGPPVSYAEDDPSARPPIRGIEWTVMVVGVSLLRAR